MLHVLLDRQTISQILFIWLRLHTSIKAVILGVRFPNHMGPMSINQYYLLVHHDVCDFQKYLFGYFGYVLCVYKMALPMKS